ncbi:MAG TPA: PD-(D/E)XK nuclease family protein [Solirubrobacterales bacterium]|nr:PD-(D/E)XK nuclease family protein [Solirubrobacterales bacterium]
MALSLIVGPPNSGKAGEILALLEAQLERDPVLVVPRLDDADRVERELCAAGNGRAVLGVSIRTFGRLFEDVAQATGRVVPPSLTEHQRLHVVRRAVERARPRTLARSSVRPGFAPALAALIGEAQAALLDPPTLAANAAAAGPDPPYLGELAALYREYAATRDALGYGDDHLVADRAMAALQADPAAWAGRPVFVYGFDDLTVEQLELIATLADATEVTVSVAYEDRAALTARARLHQELAERGGLAGSPLEPNPSNTESEVLHHLERSFLRDRADRLEPDDGLVLMEAAGERGQAEQIGGEIARLVAAGVEPDDIAVVLRTPDRYSRLYEAVLTDLAIPVAVEADVPLAGTAVGRGLLALLRAATGSMSAEDVLAFVRTPGVASSGDADWLERSIRRRALRTASEALEAWNGRALFELEDLAGARASSEYLYTAARLARRIAERPHERDAPVPDPRHRLELRAAALAAEALEAVAELSGVEEAAREATSTLEEIEVPLWRGPTDGHVRVTSPYRIRAGRVAHLFVASLQEGEFPRHDPGAPFLADEQRAALGMPGRADVDEEERYLFHVCLSRPTRRLYLCWRSCNDEGAEEPRSPFLDDVRDLLAPPPPSGDPDPLDHLVRRRRLGDVVYATAEAPTMDELARSLAVEARDTEGESIPAELGLPDAQAQRLGERLHRAARAVARRRLEPGPLSVPAVLDELRARELFGASTLEEYAVCSYRWFVQHELRAETLAPEPDGLAQGAVIHWVLENLYRDPPAGGPLPRPDTLGAWRRRAAELIAARAAEHDLGGADARSLTARARMTALIGGHLGREAVASPSLRPDPALLEASFGDGEEDDRPALELNGFRLHGKIDRIDVPAEDNAAGLVRDYKVSREVTSRAKLEKEGKLQPQLYALALDRLWKRRALGGLYQPLAGTKSHRMRGIAVAEESDGLLANLDLYGSDLVPEDDFRAALERAAERAGEIVASMREGRIDRDPIDDSCPRYCTFQAICRRERSARQEPDPLEADEEEE